MTETQITILIAGAGLAVSALNALYQRRQDYAGRIGSLSERLSKLEGSSEVSWRILEFYAGKTLHRHEDELHIDYYLDRYDRLTADEAQAFVNRLHEIAEDTTIADGTKIVAAIKMAAVIKRYGEQFNLTVPEGLVGWMQR